MHNERPMPTPLPPPRRSHTPPSYISLEKYKKKTNVPAPFATNRNLCGNRKNVFIIDWPIDSSNINFYFFYSRKVEQNTLETASIVYRKYLYYRCEQIRLRYMHPQVCLATYFRHRVWVHVVVFLTFPCVEYIDSPSTSGYIHYVVFVSMVVQ